MRIRVILLSVAVRSLVAVVLLFSLTMSNAYARNAAAPGIDGGYLASVTSVSPAEFWMAGRYYRNSNGPYGLIERWDGDKGSITPTPLPNQQAAFEDISGTSPTDVWAVGERVRGSGGEGQSALIIHWNGTAWHRVPNPLSASARSSLSHVIAISPTDAWAVGSASGGYSAAFEHWNGRRWSTVRESVTGPQGLITALTAVSPDDVWAVGQNYNGQGDAPSVPLIAHWNGKVWAIVPAHDTNVGGGGLGSIRAINRNDMWAVVNAGLKVGQEPV